MTLALAIVAIGILALIFVLFPYLRRSGEATPGVEEGPLEALREEKARIYRALKEISFEREAGHLSEDDYQQLKQRYESQAAHIVSRLEAAGKSAQRQPTKAEAGTKAAPPEIHWSRRPITLVFGSLALVAFGLTLGLGITRYTAPDQGAMPTPGPAMPSPEIETTPAPPPGAARPGERTITPEMLKGMLSAAHQSLDEGRYQEAIAAYKAVLNRHPQNVEALTHLGIILALAGHLDNAIEALDKAIALDPTYGHAYWDKARILSEQKQDLRGAIQAWEKFVQHVGPGPDRDRALRMIEEAKGKLSSQKR